MHGFPSRRMMTAASRVSTPHASVRAPTTRVLASLTPREERVLRMRCGIGRDARVWQRTLDLANTPLTDHLETLRLRRFGPQPVGPTHRRRPLRAGPPGVVDVVGGPDHQGGDFGGVSEGDQGLTAHKAGRPALCLAIAIQELSGLVNLVGLAPVMRENTDHADLLKASEATIAFVQARGCSGRRGAK